LHVDPTRRTIVLGPRAHELRSHVGSTAWVVLEEMMQRSTGSGGDVVAQMTIRSLASSLGLAKDTVARAVRRLRDLGFIVAVQARAESTQISRIVRGRKRDAQRMAAALEAGAGSASPAGRNVSEVLDAWVDQNLDPSAAAPSRDQQSRVRSTKQDKIALMPIAGAQGVGDRHEVAPARSPPLVGHRLDWPTP
jgi:DNA-binding transcriptional regulator YhcF (GntR family)